MIAAGIFYAAVASAASFCAALFATLASLATSLARLTTAISSSFASFSAKPTLLCKTSSNPLKAFRKCVELAPPSPLQAFGALSLLQIIDVLIGVLVGVLVVAAACVVAALAVRRWQTPQQQSGSNSAVLSCQREPQQHTQRQSAWSLVRAAVLPPIESPSHGADPVARAAAPNGKWASVRKRLIPSDSGGKVVKPYTSVLELIAPETQRRRELWQAELEEKAALRRGSYKSPQKASPAAPLESQRANLTPSLWSKVRGAALVGVRKPLESSASPRLKALNERGTAKLRAEWQQEKQLRNEKAALRPRQLTKGFSEPSSKKLRRQPRASPSASSSAASSRDSPSATSASCATSTPRRSPTAPELWLPPESPSLLHTFVTGPSSPVRTFIASITPPSLSRPDSPSRDDASRSSSPQPHFSTPPSLSPPSSPRCDDASRSSSPRPHSSPVLPRMPSPPTPSHRRSSSRSSSPLAHSSPASDGPPPIPSPPMPSPRRSRSSSPRPHSSPASDAPAERPGPADLPPTLPPTLSRLQRSKGSPATSPAGRASFGWRDAAPVLSRPS